MMNLQPFTIKHKQLKTDAQFFVRPGTSDVKAIEQVYRIQSYRRKAFAVEPGDKWLDMGANVGAFSVYAGQYGCEVISVEAEAVNAELTRMNIEANGRPARVLQQAVVPDDFVGDTIRFHVHTANRPMALRRHSIYQPKKDFTTVDIPCRRFSTFAALGHDCVKMNIEGVEIAVLMAAHDFGWVRKMVLEWSFDKDPKIATLDSAMAKLRQHFSYVDINRKITPGLKEWTFYPPNAFIYCIK